MKVKQEQTFRTFKKADVFRVPGSCPQSVQAPRFWHRRRHLWLNCRLAPFPFRLLGVLPRVRWFAAAW